VWVVAGTTRGEREADPAVAQARRVVGLYGDPRVSWAVLLELDLAEPLSVADLEHRLAVVVRREPHLGRVPPVLAEPESWEQVRTRFAAEPFGDRDPLLRVALSSAPARLLVAAHHGVVDGLGLLGLVGELIGRPLGSNARGLARTGAEVGFLRGTAARLGEIAFRPPERFAGAARLRAGGTGEVLVAKDLPVLRRGTAALAWSGFAALRTWNGPQRRLRQPIAAIGVSRRSGEAPLAPVRDTAFTRLHLGTVADLPGLATALAQTPPEPDFPETEGGRVGRALSRWATAALGPRLGSSFLASNLGVIDAGGAASAVRFWPAPSGPAGVALGLASVAGSMTVTVRVRRPWFDDAAAARILALVVEALRLAQ
jgi:hypothetical protein